MLDTLISSLFTLRQMAIGDHDPKYETMTSVKVQTVKTDMKSKFHRCQSRPCRACLSLFLCVFPQHVDNKSPRLSIEIHTCKNKR